jgi:hypothetical protein
MGQEMEGFWDALGFGALILCVALGFGGCFYFGDRNDTQIRLAQEQTRQLELKLELQKAVNQ